MLVAKTFNTTNNFNQIGDLFDFDIEVPLRGWANLQSISLSTTGTTVGRFLSVFVSYSIDGVNYTSFEPLSSAIFVPIKSDFIVKIRLIRAGVDNTGTLALSSITLNGDFQQSYYDVWDLSGTVFSEIKYEDERFNKIWLNLFEKVYKDGVLPKYMERSDGLTPDEEEGFVEYWKSQCMFWALAIEMAYRKIEGLMDSRAELLEYLKQKTFFFCEDDITLEQLQFIAQNTFDEMRQRGTHLIHFRTNVPPGYTDPIYVIPTDLEKKVDGELLRYLCHDVLREHVLGYLPRLDSGWLADRFSPNYFAFPHVALNKAPENTSDFVDLSNFVVINPSQTYIDNVVNNKILTEDNNFHLTTEDGYTLVCDDANSFYGLYIGSSPSSGTSLLELEQTDGTFFVLEDSTGYIALEDAVEAGIEGNGIKMSLIVDAKLSYECSCYVYSETPNNESFSVWVKAYTDAGQTYLLRADGALPVTLEAGVVFQKGPKQANKKYLFRFCIDSIYEFVNTQDIRTNWLVGSNLRFYDENTNRIEVFLMNQGEDAFYLYDLKFRPMKIESTQCLDSYNTLVLLSALNNKKVRKEQFVNDVTQYLLPYGSGFSFQDLNEKKVQHYLLQEDGAHILSEDETKIII